MISTERVTVALGGKSYDIIIEDGLLSNCVNFLVDKARDSHFCVITDENVAEHILPQFRHYMETQSIKIKPYILPAGEVAKNWDNLQKLCEWLIENGVERNDHIIALGGGVVGDITGFAAHIIKRGCNFIQIPSTLLAQVDSSVGGKTAINSANGKNLIGAFHQPSLVLIDPQILNSLPKRELAAGFAEVVKYGLIQDSEFFQWCENNIETFFGQAKPERATVRSYAIKKSVETKAAIVAADEEERNGVRALLNLGHTFGHALEAETGFGDILLHGEGVAMGMILAFGFSEMLNLCPTGRAKRIASLLAKAKLPSALSDIDMRTDGKTLVHHMLHDKKMSAGKLPFLLAHDIGKSFLAHNIDLKEIITFLDEMIAAQ